jgi:hypothetical protein
MKKRRRGMQSSNSPEKDPYAMWADHFNLDEEYLRYILIFYKVLAFPAIFAALLIFYDIVAPASFTDEAVIQSKQERYQSGHKYHLQARGERFGHFEEVSKDLYVMVEPGDTIVIKMSPIFLEARSVTFVENGKARAESGGGEIAAMALFAVACFSTLLPFIKGISLFSRAYSLFIILCPIVGLVSIAVLFKLFIAFIGVIDRV